MGLSPRFAALVLRHGRTPLRLDYMGTKSGIRWRAGLRAALLVASLLTSPAASAVAVTGALPNPAPTGAVPDVISPHTTAARPLPASLAWSWPLARDPRVIHAFNPPDKPWLTGHRGVDLLAPQGAEVLAPATGVVTFSGVVVDRPVLTITMANGLRLSLEPVASPLRAGEAVARGQPVGTLSGKTHCDAGPPGENSCLHWGVRRGEIYLNPLAFILDLRPSVLLPVMDMGPS